MSKFPVPIALPIMTRLFLLLVVFVLSGCTSTIEYLNPEGKGNAYVVGNPCPYAYKVLEVRGTKDHEVRVTVGAFWKGEYRLTKTTLFLVASDIEVMGYQVGQFHSPALKRQRAISFPNGTNVKVVLPSGEVIEGQFAIDSKGEPTRNAALLSFPISEQVLDEFTAFLPPVMVDGELFNFGAVRFKRTSETWPVGNC